MAAIPEQYLDLLSPTKKSFAHLATLMKDGSPQVTPVWLDFTDGMIRVNTARGRVKDRNLKVGSRVALSISDPDNPYRYVQIRGKVAKETEQGADAHIDSLAKKYMGVDSYPYRNAAEKRVIYYIEPVSGQGMNYADPRTRRFYKFSGCRQGIGGYAPPIRAAHLYAHACIWRPRRGALSAGGPWLPAESYSRRSSRNADRRTRTCRPRAG